VKAFIGFALFALLLAVALVWYLTLAGQAQAYCDEIGLIRVPTAYSWACVEGVMVP
jgi:hypothetical protein